MKFLIDTTQATSFWVCTTPYTKQGLVQPRPALGLHRQYTLQTLEGHEHAKLI